MSGFIGADPDELRILAKHMDTSAEQLDGTRTDLLSYFQRVRWAGEDGNRAKGQFRTAHAKKMQQVTSLLRETADLVRKQAQEQTQTSSNGSIFPPGIVIAKPLPAFLPGPAHLPPTNILPLPAKLLDGLIPPDFFEKPNLPDPDQLPPRNFVKLPAIIRDGTPFPDLSEAPQPRVYDAYSEPEKP